MAEENINQDGFESYEYDSGIGSEGGRFNQEIKLDDDVLAVFVAIEGGANVSIGGQSLENDDKTIARQEGAQHLYFKVNPVEKGGGETTLRVQAETGFGKRLRAFIVVLRRGLKFVWGKLKCPACKKLVRMLLMLILTGGASLHVIWADTKLSSLHLPNFVEIFKNICDGNLAHLPPALASFFKDAPWLVDVINAMRNLLGFLDKAFDFVDKFLEAVCRQLKMCS